MQEKLLYKFYIWLMGWSGALSAWAWRKHAKILKDRQQVIHDNLIRKQENQTHLERLNKNYE